MVSITARENLLDMSMHFRSFKHRPVDVELLNHGRLLHAQIVKAASEIHNHAQKNLLLFYCDCGCLEDAYTIFNGGGLRTDQISWSIMISALIRIGCSDEARHLFDQMLIEGNLPNKVVYSSLLSYMKSLSEGHRLHTRIHSTDLISDVIVGTALVTMYAKCRSLDYACTMFNIMPVKDVVSYTALISACVQHGNRKMALEVFDQMQHDMVIPSRVTFINLLSACMDSETGKQIHEFIKRDGFELDVVVSNALISMYGRCGSIENARLVFDSMPERNLISWNAMLSGYAQNGYGNEVLCLMARLHQDALPDGVSLVCALSVCANVDALTEGRRLHCCVISSSNLDSNIIVENAVINMYGNCGSLYEAFKAFDKTADSDVITWNVLISICANKGEPLKALQLLHQMRQQGMMANKITFVSAISSSTNLGDLTAGRQLHCSAGNHVDSDVVVGTAVVNMYGKFQMPHDAWKVFLGMTEKNTISWAAMITAFAQNGQINAAFGLFNMIIEKQDVVLWNSMISALSQNCLGKNALAQFEQMLQEGIMPDKVTFLSILDGVSSESLLYDGKCTHSRIVCSVLQQDRVINNALIYMYGKCGNLQIAQQLFNQMPKCDTFSWSSIIAAYAQTGQGKYALGLFKHMQHEGRRHEKVSFVHVLSACSHAGLLSEGCRYFLSMKDDYGFTPTIDHYNCMIDLLARCGRLDEVEELICSMQIEPTVVSWLTVLSASQRNLDIRRGEWAANAIFKLDPTNATPYVMLSSIYTKAEQPNNATNIMHRMRNTVSFKHNNEIIGNCE